MDPVEKPSVGCKFMNQSGNFGLCVGSQKVHHILMIDSLAYKHAKGSTGSFLTATSQALMDSFLSQRNTIITCAHQSSSKRWS